MAAGERGAAWGGAALAAWQRAQHTLKACLLKLLRLSDFLKWAPLSRGMSSEGLVSIAASSSVAFNFWMSQ